MTVATVFLAPAYNPGSWSTYFALTGTAAATLTGLFFVAFSLRVRELPLSAAGGPAWGRPGCSAPGRGSATREAACEQ